LKHQVAFFQWRKKYRPETADPDEIEECLESVTTYLQDTFDPNAKVTPETKKEGALTT